MSNNNEELRDKYRSLTIGKKKHFKTKVYDYVTTNNDGEEETLKVEFREPSRKVRSDMVKKSTVNNEFDPEKFGVLCVINLTYIPDTNIKIFEETDVDSFMETPASSSFVELFAGEITDLITKEDGKKAEKN